MEPAADWQTLGLNGLLHSEEDVLLVMIGF